MSLTGSDFGNQNYSVIKTVNRKRKWVILCQFKVPTEHF